MFALPVQWVLCVSQREMNWKSTGLCVCNLPAFVRDTRRFLAEKIWRAETNKWNEEEHILMFTLKQSTCRDAHSLLELSPFFSTIAAGFHVRKYFFRKRHSSKVKQATRIWTSNLFSPSIVNCWHERECGMVKTENRSVGSSPHSSFSWPDRIRLQTSLRSILSLSYWRFCFDLILDSRQYSCLVMLRF